MPVFSIAIFVVAAYTVYTYFRNAPSITVDDEKITFNRQTYYWIDLENIALTGKQMFHYIRNFPLEATTLKFKNGNEKIIFDDMYENAWKIKSFLHQLLIDKKHVFEINVSETNNAEFSGNYVDTFKGNQFTSYRGILMWGMIILLLYGVIKFQAKKGLTTAGVYFLWFMIAYAVFWFFIFSWQMNYFQLSEQIFLVRNQNLLWRRKAYLLKNIKEIVFETQGKRPNCLRVITKDYRNKLYPAGTLRKGTWLELKDKLESYGITVRNECI